MENIEDEDKQVARIVYNKELDKQLQESFGSDYDIDLKEVKLPKYSKDRFIFYPEYTQTGKKEYWWKRYGGSRIVGKSTEGYSRLTKCRQNAERNGFNPLIHIYIIK